jgi:endonuclease YncB( thermonuclease family)
MKKILFTLLLLTLASHSHAACYPNIIGTVSSVTDGDTLTVKTNTNPALKIRLAEIDAPETSHFGSLTQPYGEESKAVLSNLILNKTITISPHAIDTYGRTLATVYYTAPNTTTTLNVNKYLVKQGAAWAYTFFVLDKSLITLQNQAKTARLGLWLDPNPIEPSVWRSTH